LINNNNNNNNNNNKCSLNDGGYYFKPVAVVYPSYELPIAAALAFMVSSVVLIAQGALESAVGMLLVCLAETKINQSVNDRLSLYLFSSLLLLFTTTTTTTTTIYSLSCFY